MKTWKELIREYQSASSGIVKGLGKPPEDGPPVPKKKRKKFAGADVFDVSNEEYMSAMKGRQKYERWSTKFNMDEIECKEIRSFAHRHPQRPIVLKNNMTGEMMYMRRFEK